MVYDEIAQHLAQAESVDRAAVPLGMFVAWCVNMNLVSELLLQTAEQLVLRVRYREITGSELLVAGLGGRLESKWLNSAGNAFCREHYSGYLDDYAREFGLDIYGVRDDWDHYDRIAPQLTARLYGPARRGEKQGDRRWWQFWR